MNLPDVGTWGEQTITLMAIDPGSSSLGIAVYDISLRDRSIVSSHAFTVHSHQSSYYLKEDSKRYGDRTARMSAMHYEMDEWLYHYQPSIVICESPFFNRLMPAAFGVLNELLVHIRHAVRAYNNHVPFFTVDPPTAKKAVGAKGNAKKDDMTVAIRKIASTLRLNNHIDDLDEHAIDALAIGYFGYKTYVIGDLHAEH